jgi:hypothetical protein
MSSTPQSIPLTRRIQGGLATLIAVGVLLAIAVAVTVIAVSNANNTTQARQVRTSQANVGSTPHTRQTRYLGRELESRGLSASTPQTRYLGPRQAGAGVNGRPGPAAAVGNTASSPTVQPNPDRQGITPHNLVRGEDLPGWLLR